MGTKIKIALVVIISSFIGMSTIEDFTKIVSISVVIFIAVTIGDFFKWLEKK